MMYQNRLLDSQILSVSSICENLMKSLCMCPFLSSSVESCGIGYTLKNLALHSIINLIQMSILMTKWFIICILILVDQRLVLRVHTEVRCVSLVWFISVGSACESCTACVGAVLMLYLQWKLVGALHMQASPTSSQTARTSSLQQASAQGY